MTMTDAPTKGRKTKAQKELSTAFQDADRELRGIDTVQRWFNNQQTRMLDIEIDVAAANIAKNYPYKAVLNQALDKICEHDSKASDRKAAISLVLRRMVGLT